MPRTPTFVVALGGDPRILALEGDSQLAPVTQFVWPLVRYVSTCRKIFVIRVSCHRLGLIPDWRCCPCLYFYYRPSWPDTQ